jgi:hypothetical protein
VCDFASENLLQSILVTLTITVPGPLAITSQTWMPVNSGGLHGYSVTVHGTASGPIGSQLGGGILRNDSNDVNIVAASWSGSWGFPPSPVRESGDPETTFCCFGGIS